MERQRNLTRFNENSRMDLVKRLIWLIGNEFVYVYKDRPPSQEVRDHYSSIKITFVSLQSQRFEKLMCRYNGSTLSFTVSRSLSDVTFVYVSCHLSCVFGYSHFTILLKLSHSGTVTSTIPFWLVTIHKLRGGFTVSFIGWGVLILFGLSHSGRWPLVLRILKML